MDKLNMGLNNLCNKIIQICMTIVFLAILSMAFLRLSKTQNDRIREDIEEFTNKLKREDMKDIKYVKFAETFMETDKDDKWDGLTLYQAIDKCGGMPNCIGFNRENIGDNEDGICYPVKLKGKCHTSNKGNFDQRHYAIGFNFFLKPDSELDKINVTTAEIGFLSGVTSNIQDQLDSSGIDTTQDVAFTSSTPATSSTAAALTVTGGIGLGGFIKQF